MKTVKTIALIVLVFVFVYCVWQLFIKKDENTHLKEVIAQNEETIGLLRGNIDSINGQLEAVLELNSKLQAEYDANIAQRQREQEAARLERKKLLGKITVLETELEPLIAANPKLQELIAAFKAADAASQAQIVALEAERDAWIQKYNLKDQDFRAALLAKTQMQENLEASLLAFTKCNNELVTADKTITKLKKQNKAVKVLVLIETGILGGLAIF